MEVCSINWELVSKFIPLITGIVPIGITWFLYEKWHDQKGKEVISSFSKELILKDIDVYYKIYNSKDIVELEKNADCINNYMSNIKLFTYLIKEENNKSILNNLYNIYNDAYKSIKKKEEFKDIREKFFHVRKKNKISYISVLTKYMKYEI